MGHECGHDLDPRQKRSCLRAFRSLQLQRRAGKPTKYGNDPSQTRVASTTSAHSTKRNGSLSVGRGGRSATYFSLLEPRSCRSVASAGDPLQGIRRKGNLASSYQHRCSSAKNRKGRLHCDGSVVRRGSASPARSLRSASRNSPATRHLGTRMLGGECQRIGWVTRHGGECARSTEVLHIGGSGGAAPSFVRGSANSLPGGAGRPPPSNSTPRRPARRRC